MTNKHGYGLYTPEASRDEEWAKQGNPKLRDYILAGTQYLIEGIFAMPTLVLSDIDLEGTPKKETFKQRAHIIMQNRLRRKPKEEIYQRQNRYLHGSTGW